MYIISILGLLFSERKRYVSTFSTKLQVLRAVTFKWDYLKVEF